MTDHPTEGRSRDQVRAVVARIARERFFVSQDGEWADRLLSALHAAGLVVVPREPTMDMGLKGADEVNKQMRGPGASADYDAAMDAYRAMIAAANKGDQTNEQEHGKPDSD